MKIIFCAYDDPDYVGGPNAWLRRLLPKMLSRGVNPGVLFITGAEPERCPTVRALRGEGLKCESVCASHVPHTEDRVKWILGRLAEDPPDVFVPNLMVPAYYAGRWAKEAGIPSVGILHSDDDFHEGLQEEFIFGKEDSRVSAMVCVSKHLEKSVLSKNPRGVVIARIPYGVVVPGRAAGNPGEKLRVVYTGRLEEKQKRISELARAFCRAAREVPGVEAAIYGSGSSERNVSRIIRERGGGLPVRLAGSVDSSGIQSHLLKSHVIVLLSDYEGLPISLMEGMACGLVPVCLRTRSGIPELVEDGVTGFIVEDRGDSFISAIRKLRGDPGLWERMSEAAREKISREYSIEACAAGWAELFAELKAGAPRRRRIIVPDGLPLPPPRKEFLREDERKPHLVFIPFRKLRRAAGRVKDRIAGKRPAPGGPRPAGDPNRYYSGLLHARVETVCRKHLGGADEKGLALADLGCGSSPYRKIFEKRVSAYAGVDLAGNESADFHPDGSGKAPLPDGWADVVLSTQVLEHVESPAAYLGECSRLLKPGGLLIISTHGLWHYHPDPSDYWRWTSAGLRKTLAEAGFSVVDFYGVMGPAASAVQLFQNAVMHRVPAFAGGAFAAVMQGLCAFCDRMTGPSTIEKDAGVYLAAARKPPDAGRRSLEAGDARGD